MGKINELFASDIKVINMGLVSFAKDLKEQKINVIHVDWKPPAGGNQKMASLLAKLKGK
ncbi:fdrA domain protein [Anaerosolibacter sp.]|uniref:fdrA domain protein n=1 Tax=Anaerosolibacter sp. TaxID=1872527 RepID=UPI0039F06732